MPDTNLPTSETSVIPSVANVIPSEASAILSEAPVILSEAKDLSPLGTPTDEDTQVLDLALDEELIIEDFTIDGICGVY